MSLNAPARSPKRCLLCCCEYTQAEDGTLFPEAFCSQACERLHAAHVIDYYRENRSEMDQVESGHTETPLNLAAPHSGQACVVDICRRQPCWKFLLGSRN